MKISILLPYKENFSPSYPGAVSIFVKDTTKLSKYKNNITVYGSTHYKKKLLNNYYNLPFKKELFQSSSQIYLDNFLINENKNKSDLIEIHNRPSYVNKISNNTNSKIVLYFHNDPLNMSGSKSINERLNLINKTEKIIFNSEWSKKRFLENLNKLLNKSNKLEVINQSTNKTKINLNEKKKIIVFAGKLNSAKGYDIFGKAIIKILDKYNDWQSIVIGDEPREKIIFDHKNLKLLGFVDHNKVLNYFKDSSIAVACSRWEEPFGRTSLEASSRGCAVIISNRGGLPETVTNAIILKKLSEKNLFNSIEKLIKNKKLRRELQSKSIKNFYLTNKYISKKIDLYRIKLLKNNITTIKNTKKKIHKILHITNFNERHNGRLHYNTGKRINNGFIRLGHNVLSLSDRDILKQNKSLTDISGIKTLNNRIITTIENFKPDTIVLGHADNITVDTIKKIKKLYNPVVCQWFLDPLIKNGPDYKRNKKRITHIDKFIDATFITTHPDEIDFKINKSFFMPNPCDIAFESLDNSKSKPTKDLFFAMSHGVHRGVLKGGKNDDREKFLNKLKVKIPNIKFDIFGMDDVQPIWGDKFLNTLSNYKMGLNLSRGKPIKYYSSDRIVQLIANGLLTFIDKKTKLNEIISSKGVVYYDNINDLIKKINFYKKNPKLAVKISSIGRKEYFKKFNSNIISNYIIEKSHKLKSRKKYSWN